MIVLITFTYSRWANIITGFAFALVAILGIDAFTSAANIGSQNALVDLTHVARFLAQLSVRIFQQ